MGDHEMRVGVFTILTVKIKFLSVLEKTIICMSFSLSGTHKQTKLTLDVSNTSYYIYFENATVKNIYLTSER